MPPRRGRAPRRIVGGCAAFVLLTGCGAAAQTNGPPTTMPSPTARSAWTPAQADVALATAVKPFSRDLDDLYRLRNETHPVASYAVQCGVLLPELSRFVAFLRAGRWPADVDPLVQRLVRAQTAYNAALRTCSAAMTRSQLRVGLRQLDAAPVRQRLARLRGALASRAG